MSFPTKHSRMLIVRSATNNFITSSVSSARQCCHTLNIGWGRSVSANVGSWGAMWCVIIAIKLNVSLPKEGTKECHGSARIARALLTS